MAKSTLDKNIDKVTTEFNKVADDVKDTAGDIGNRWSRSSLEEKITMIIWILLLVWALFELKKILWGVILLILGLLLVSGFFDRALGDFVAYCKKEFWAKKKASAKSAEKKSDKKNSK